MKTLRRFLRRAASSTRRCDEERLREELEQHVALQTAENLRAGLSPVEARRRAVLKLGAVEAIKEHYRDEQGLPVLDSLVRDVRYGSRALWRSPGFAVVAVASLALGAGCTGAVGQSPGEPGPETIPDGPKQPPITNKPTTPIGPASR